MHSWTQQSSWRGAATTPSMQPCSTSRSSRLRQTRAVRRTRSHMSRSSGAISQLRLVEPHASQGRSSTPPPLPTPDRPRASNLDRLPQDCAFLLSPHRPKGELTSQWRSPSRSNRCGCARWKTSHKVIGKPRVIENHSRIDRELPQYFCPLVLTRLRLDPGPKVMCSASECDFL